MAAYRTTNLHHFVANENSKNVKSIPTLMCSLQPSLGNLFLCFPSSRFPFDSRKGFGGPSYHSSTESFVVLEMAEEKVNLAGPVKGKMIVMKLQERS